MTDRRSAPGERSVDELLAFGVVNLDKPAGPSAHQVSAWARDAAGVDRAAHAGTLDPKVTGCLPILLGDATRVAQVFLEGTKEYIAVLELHGPVPADFESVVSEFEGEIYQKPPRKSAVTRRLRSRTIHDLDVIETTERQALLRIRCESGTYVRKLCHDLGLAVGTGAHMGDLRRTATDPFDDTNLASTADLTDALAFAAEGDEEPLREVVAPAERALRHLPQLTVADSAAEQIAEGAPVYAPGVVDADAAVESAAAEGGDSDAETPLVVCVTPDGTAVCLGRLVGKPSADRGTVVSLERVLV
ncbi:RNA-guided pseudouridylation complex pseudouridine synthase subunit Cbf5 [Halobellus ruber]|uniref:Probable tRNA pseudouridine synthase B n=1 Tax=Halobellus ruber TaxID=2761102 RepID=A0A7J9SHS0_9EURY|nr:RNA-guided pseudouridylation complex pseudouridine synthase subunit Cbf5 [Halobellus ruber]